MTDGPGGSDPNQTQTFGGGDILSSLVNLGGLLIQKNADKKAQERQNRYNKAEAELAYQRQQEMWNQQNIYNSPANQMKLLMEAGLNPNLAHGQAIANAGASSPPEYQAARGQFQGISQLAQIAPAIEAYQRFRMQNAQIASTQQKTENEAVKNDLLLESVTGKRTSNLISEINRRRADLRYDTEGQLQPYQVEAAKHGATTAHWKSLIASREYENQFKQGQLIDANADRQRAETMFRKYQNEWMKLGITSSDNAFVRIIARMLHETGMLPDWSVLKNIKP